MIEKLPRREREILEIIYTLREASAADIRLRMSDTPSDSATRALLSRLEGKSLVRHRVQDQRFIYSATVGGTAVGRNALRRLMETFFGNSPVSAATALLGVSRPLTADEAAELRKAIDASRRRLK